MIKVTVADALKNPPFIPELSEEARKRGLDIVIEEALPKAGALEIVSLIEKISSLQRILLPDQEVSFNVGLLSNVHFMRSCKESTNLLN